MTAPLANLLGQGEGKERVHTQHTKKKRRGYWSGRSMHMHLEPALALTHRSTSCRTNNHFEEKKLASEPLLYAASRRTSLC